MRRSRERRLPSEPPGMRAGSLHVRQRLLKAAVLLLSEHGLQGATARAICHQAGVKAPTLYHYFGDLGRLHTAAVNVSFLSIMAEYRREARAAGPIQAIRRSWGQFMKFADHEPRLARLMIDRVLDGDMPNALRLTLWQLRRDLALLEKAGQLAVAPAVAVTLLWTAAAGAALMVTQQHQNQRETAEANARLLDAALEALLGRAVGRQAEPFRLS